MTTLTTTHQTPDTDPDALFSKLAQATIEFEAERARFESHIADLKAEFDDATAALADMITGLENELTTYILAHPDLFRSPRQHKTEWGSYGLRYSTRLVVEDEAAIIAHCEKTPDCAAGIETRTVAVKSEVKRLLTEGQLIPGASLAGGEIASYTVAKALIEKARADV